MNTQRISLFIALLLAVVAMPSGARADGALDEGLSKLATSVAKFLKDENRGSAINVGEFIAPPRMQASGGRGLSEAMASAFKKQGVDVRTDAPMQLIGRFSVREEKENATNDFDSVALRLRAEVMDANDEVVQTFNISVFGSAALQVPGVTVDLPPKASEGQRQQQIKERIENPQAAIVGTETRATTTSPYGIEVMVSRMPRGPMLVEGRSFVPLERGEEYIVRLHNRSQHEAAATLTIDGLSMFAFSKEGNFGSQVIIPPGSHTDIPGWYISNSETAAYLITSYPDSGAGKKGATSNIGTITCTFAACWDPAAAPPADEAAASRSAENATGLGRKIDLEYKQVKRISGQPRAVVSVRYNR
jgi:hypothetical protein